MCSIMERNDTPSVLLNWLRSRCVPIGVKRLKVLTTCREFWVSGKPSSQSARGVDIPPTTRLASSGYLVRRVGIRVARATRNTGFVVVLQTYVLHFGSAYGPAVACGGSDPRVGMKGKRLLRNNRWMFQARELGLPCKVKFDSESSASIRQDQVTHIYNRIIKISQHVSRNKSV
jgi:hypothetical protein